MPQESTLQSLTGNRPAQLSRLGFMEIGEEDRRLLRELEAVLAPHIDRIIGFWYDFLLSREETKRLLSSALVEGHLKLMQARYFRELLAASHDEEYFKARLRIGLIHHQVGLAPDWYLGAYRKYWDLVQSFLQEQGFEKEKVVAWTRALQKVMYLDMALAIDAYWDRYVQTLREAKEAAETASAAKSEFMAMVTHELKNPMNSVIGYTDLLLDEIEGPVNEAQRESLHHIRRSSEHLLRLIEEILDFSRVERGRDRLQGKLKLRRVEFPIRETLRETVTSLTEKARRKGLQLLLNVSEDIPNRVLGDPDRLRQIVTNLAENAIKFTDRGRIEVYAHPEIQRIHRSDRRCIQFGVRDTGIGIAAEKQKDVFRPFVQVRSPTQARGGLGLGLAISLELVELMDGRIWLESEVGKGSTFNFTACFGSPRGEIEASPLAVMSYDAPERRHHHTM